MVLKACLASGILTWHYSKEESIENQGTCKQRKTPTYDVSGCTGTFRQEFLAGLFTLAIL